MDTTPKSRRLVRRKLSFSDEEDEQMSPQTKCWKWLAVDQVSSSSSSDSSSPPPIPGSPSSSSWPSLLNSDKPASWKGEWKHRKPSTLVAPNVGSQSPKPSRSVAARVAMDSPKPSTSAAARAAWNSQQLSTSVTTTAGWNTQQPSTSAAARAAGISQQPPTLVAAINAWSSPKRYPISPAELQSPQTSESSSSWAWRDMESTDTSGFKSSNGEPRTPSYDTTTSRSPISDQISNSLCSQYDYADVLKGIGLEKEEYDKRLREHDVECVVNNLLNKVETEIAEAEAKANVDDGRPDSPEYLVRPSRYNGDVSWLHRPHQGLGKICRVPSFHLGLSVQENYMIAHNFILSLMTQGTREDLTYFALKAHQLVQLVHLYVSKNEKPDKS